MSSYFLRKNIILSSFIFLFFQNSIIGNTSIYESLKEIPLTKKALFLNSQAKKMWWEESKESVEKIFEYSTLALEFSKKLNQIDQIIDAYLNFGFYYYRKKNYEKGIISLNKSLKLSEKKFDTPRVYNSLKILTHIYNVIPEYKLLIKLYDRMIKICKELGDDKEEANCLRYKGIVYFNMGHLNKSILFMKEAKLKYEEINDIPKIVLSLEYIGSLYQKQGENEKTIEKYIQALKISDENDLYLNKIRLYLKLGSLYFSLKSFKKSLTYYNEALEISKKYNIKHYLFNIYQGFGDIHLKENKLDLALSHYRNSLNEKYKINKQESFAVAEIYMKIGDIYFSKKKIEQAIYNFKYALKITKKYKEIDIQMDCLLKLGTIYLINSEINNANFYFTESTRLLEFVEDINLRLNYFKFGINLNEKKLEFKKALNYYKEYFELNEQLFNEKSSEKIANIESKYQVEQKEKENELLKKNNEIQRMDLVQQKVVRNLIIIILVLTLIILGFLIRKYSFLLAFWKKKNFISHYRLRDKLGSGGSGVVYKATDVHDKSREVAVKVLREEGSSDPNYIQRFKTEGTIIDRFNHPNIVKVIERGEANNTLFLAMELLNGKNLGKVIEEESPLKFGRIYKILTEITSAVSMIHKKKIIHRDLKPDNIIIIRNQDGKEQVKLLDFGIAKSKDLTALTKTGSVLGTIHYLAPEQITSGEFTYKSDIYSLGILCYELITGEIPFTAEAEEYLFHKILNEDIKHPIELRKDTPIDLDDFIIRMTNKDQNQRPDADEVLNFFENKLGKGDSKNG